MKNNRDSSNSNETVAYNSQFSKKSIPQSGRSSGLMNQSTKNLEQSLNLNQS